MKRNIITALTLFILIGIIYPDVCTAQSSGSQKEFYRFTDIVSIPATDVKDQYKTGTCWCFSTISFLESELIRTGKEEHDLSEMFVVRNTYPVKARKYVMRWGEQNFYQGGQAHDVMQFIWGVAPQNTYITNLIVVDDDVDVHDLSEVLKAVSMNFRPDQDLFVTPRGCADLEHPGLSPRGVGAKMGIDATRKMREENYLREPPEEVHMDAAVMRKIESLWKKDGFS